MVLGFFLFFLLYSVFHLSINTLGIVDKQGKYMGAFIPRSNMIKSISAITTASQHHRDSLIYNIPMFSGTSPAD